ncbi:hypothetical protein [Streptomyces omiyaensis]|uniref:hypothetical protein n=1 Tax=Streptomyces omiyaensis TaxID=68247 RepID=UPI0036F771EF
MSRWYGSEPVWWAPFERDARLRFGSDLAHRYGDGRLTYRLSGLDVVGETDPVLVTISFYADPWYDTYGQRPQDFPRVHAKPGVASKHRYAADDALCLWYPYDPEERRWTSEKGLLDLLGIVERHLFLEHCWRRTGGHAGGDWIVEDAPHGLPEGRDWSRIGSTRPRRRRAVGHGFRRPP